MNTTPPIIPASGKRIIAIDALRGFALLGIILAHMTEYYYAGPFPEAAQEAMVSTNADGIINGLIGFLIRGKFFAIFSILFGLSFFIQMDRASQRNEAYALRFLWRLLILFIIGFFHALFYRGDILTLYAMIGVPLVLCINASNNSLLIMAIVFIVGIPKMLVLFLIESNGLALSMEDITAGEGPYFEAVIGNSWTELAKMNASYGFRSKLIFQFVQAFGRGYLTFGYFLLGMYLGRTRILEAIDTHRKTIRRWMLYGLGLIGFTILCGLATAAIIGTNIQNPSLLLQAYGTSLFDLFNTGLTIIIIGLFLQAYLKWNKANKAGLLSAYGRMGLTNYVFQSLIGTFILFGYGLGYFSILSLPMLVLLAFLNFFIQGILSIYWLKYFKYGPLEWIWRSATYGKWQVLKKPILAD